MAMNSLLSSQLYDQNTFYKAFEKDLKRARTSILIESPFITLKRMNDLLPLLRKARQRGIHVIVNSRCPVEHDQELAVQASLAIRAMHDIGINVLYTGKPHRKLEIIDHEVLWEGSLNILSQSDSCEVMRRIISTEIASQMARFLKTDGFIASQTMHISRAKSPK